MSEYLEILKECIEEARHDQQAAALLRSILLGAAKNAPVNVLVELGEVLVSIRHTDLLREVERN